MGIWMANFEWLSKERGNGGEERKTKEEERVGDGTRWKLQNEWSSLLRRRGVCVVGPHPAECGLERVQESTSLFNWAVLFLYRYLVNEVYWNSHDPNFDSKG